MVRGAYLGGYRAVTLFHGPFHGPFHGYYCVVSWLGRIHHELRRELSPIPMHCQPVWEARFVDVWDPEISVACPGSGAVLFVRVGPLLRQSTSMGLDFLIVSSMLQDWLLLDRGA